MSMIRFCLALMVTLLATDTLTAQTGPPTAKPRVDRLGDPLPAGALYRIGTRRLKLSCEIKAIAVAPDGERVAAMGYQALAVWEVPTGRELFRVPLREAGNLNLAFTADSTALFCRRDGEFCVLDAGTGKLRHKLGEAINAYVSAINGSTAIVVTKEDCVAPTIRQWDIDSGKQIKHWRLRAESAGGLWSPDGTVVATHDEPPDRPPIIGLYDAAAGATLRSWPAALKGLLQLAFSSDGKRLAAMSAQGDLCVWEVASGKQLSRCRLEGDASPSWRAPLTFAPDGASVLGRAWGKLVRWDWRTGKRLRDYGETDGPFACFPDGRRLAMAGSDLAVYLLDMQTGKDICPLPHARFAELAFAPDGCRIAWVEQSKLPDGGRDLVLADAVRGKELRRWHGDAGLNSPVAFSPDGNTLATSSRSRDTCLLWDVPHDQPLRTMEPFGGALWLRFTPDGRRLASGIFGHFCLWDVASGKRLRYYFGDDPLTPAPDLRVLAIGDVSKRQVRLMDPTSGKTVRELGEFCAEVRYRVTAPHFTDSCTCGCPLTYSPDARLLLAGSPGPKGAETDDAVVWNVTTGQARLRLCGDEVIPSNLSFSPDGRLLAAMRSDCRMALLSTTTGAVVRSLGQGADKMSAPPAFTPDGRIVITAVHGLVQLWEVATGGEIARRGGHTADVRELVMSPDGRTFATISADCTILVWDLTQLATGVPPADAEALWSDLASADAVRGRRAVEGLIAAPAVALPLMRDRLRPAAAPDAKQVARWIADLDSDDFDRRQQAERGLDRLAELAGPALRQALTTNPSLEALRRMEGLLKKLDVDTLTAEALRGVRAVQALECIGDDGARRHLRQLASGSAGARLTIDAAAALARLERRQK